MTEYDDDIATSPHFAYWRDALEGRFAELELGKAECGFYRHRRRDGAFEPIAVWRHHETGERLARIGDNTDVIPADGEFCERLFCWINRQPIPVETYWRVMPARLGGEGLPWPDQPPAIGHNQPPVSLYAQFKAELEQERAEAEAWMKKLGEPKTVEEKDRAGNWKERILRLEQRAKEQLRKEKAPHLEEARAVEEQWRPIAAGADALKRALSRFAGIWIDRENARLEEERREAEAKGRTPPPRATVKAGTGHGVTRHRVKKAVVEDAAAALLFFKDNPKLLDCLQTLANAAVRAGVTPTGCRLEETIDHR